MRIHEISRALAADGTQHVVVTAGIPEITAWRQDRLRLGSGTYAVVFWHTRDADYAIAETRTPGFAALVRYPELETNHLGVFIPDTWYTIQGDEAEGLHLQPTHTTRERAHRAIRVFAQHAESVTAGLKPLTDAQMLVQVREQLTGFRKLTEAKRMLASQLEWEIPRTERGIRDADTAAKRKALERLLAQQQQVVRILTKLIRGKTLVDESAPIKRPLYQMTYADFVKYVTLAEPGSDPQLVAPDSMGRERKIRTDKSDYVLLVLHAIATGKKVDRKTVLSGDNITDDFRWIMRQREQGLQRLRETKEPRVIRNHGGKRKLAEKITALGAQNALINKTLKLD